MNVSEWMSPDPVSVGPDTSVSRARTLLEEQGFRHLPVVDDGRLCGIVSDRDVGLSARALRRAVRGHTVHELLDDDRRLVGIITSVDCLLATMDPEGTGPG